MYAYIAGRLFSKDYKYMGIYLKIDKYMNK